MLQHIVLREPAPANKTQFGHASPQFRFKVMGQVPAVILAVPKKPLTVAVPTLKPENPFATPTPLSVDVKMPNVILCGFYRCIANRTLNHSSPHFAFKVVREVTAIFSEMPPKNTASSCHGPSVPTTSNPHQQVPRAVVCDSQMCSISRSALKSSRQIKHFSTTRHPSRHSR